VSKKIVQATIPEPYEDVRSLRTSVLALKELVEVLVGQRGINRDNEAVTFGELGQAGFGGPMLTGVWEPIISPATGAFAAATITNNGYFAKSGRFVHVWFMVSWTGLSIGSASGTIQIQPLPFVPSYAEGTYWPGYNISYSAGSTSNPQSGLGARGDRNIYLYFPSTLNGPPNNFQAPMLTANGQIWGSGAYLTDQ
jgi:hypothetical protein